MDMSENNAKMMSASAEGIGAFKPILSFGELKKGADGLVCVVKGRRLIKAQNHLPFIAPI
mgnify:CR=1 FL=1